MALFGASLAQFKRHIGTLNYRIGSVAVALVLAASGNPAHSRSTPATDATVVAANLPQEAQTTARLIRSGGPFPYEKDGVVFGNRERLLPQAWRGFYREYTVPTPGARTRGARRIVCGGAQPLTPEACYYTDDHYTSFRRIVQ